MEIAIIMQIIQAIMDCIKQRRGETFERAAEQVQTRLMDSSRRGRRITFRGIINMIRNREKLRGHELRDAAQETFRMLTDAHQDDVASLVGDAVNALKDIEANSELAEYDAINQVIVAREGSL